VGAMVLGDLCLQLETAARAGRLKPCQELLVAVDAAWQSAQAQIQSALQA